ncbi:MAG: bifunctional demethylmenaquinone methyltransferase/2-methoxy-6-polyprenyl-1,4-benzoquinol methylase [Ferrovum sp. 37-45-19]|jgi:demethylmenaquinone methyltransferase/2-methoxy-6-polyprenyl-1,4-benzoquinol methylase|uniref:bifunctional demethylmenaquinone methyltransferase/2-methoxy-6-polyprenyl-1,4-benzoquinol methylase UbiE n=1 Tax=Ferrovum sp. JA12 TaxID=1356299 RepID=UPI000702CECF|nr:bifunctional demethylmenaquinone methyltransferase/2-methoxy-6-polyprenyl-1,4-benzoquinol methylase UbiE [Ferrovum sp. JA12]OYV80509.1 MAG: bifunctional demethylmenaquinone methyltransferase/2-methoxy-6-polyprenyl-1,4-benzoquinol methylase [Ferrovum sp. 21-44-67]OYV94824.1 MAG: bifunctional demethylmenaquinone methyltransferase/2-methoxy-6-polyprenyl-1,4-benzoquinol methylase [Ferrovum sp. 37-45-19]OZB34143.1 MAG: bifunctional demethylmenaquinone methyltransferase/2-methoxy-6-polyprenyl-1,4-b
MNKTHFGFTEVDEQDKAKRVGAVFDSVAPSYDIMNDMMSLGLHRLWKYFTIQTAAIKPNERILDIASGSGDLALGFAKQLGPQGQVVMSDINGSMLERGRNRVLDQGSAIAAVQCDAESLPFPSHYFDCVSVAFGLRNMTHKDKALSEMTRILKPGGRLLVLEFSTIWAPLKPLYDLYSFKLLPKMGEIIAKDALSYQYLAESIRMHPDQQTLKTMMEQVGLSHVKWFNLTAGVVALHRGYKI